MPFIRGAASRLSRRLPPCLSKEDLIGEGIVVLLETSQRGDVPPAAFWAYASKRIVGGMVDLIRSVRKSRRGSGIEEVPFESNPRLLALITDRLSLQCADSPGHPEACLEKKEILEALERFRRSLPERLRIVTCFLYQWEFTMKYSGKLLGLSRRRVGQLHEEALKNLKKSMNATVLKN